MHSHHHRCLLLILSVSVLGSPSTAQEPNTDRQPAGKLPRRAEIEKKYDRDGDGQLSIEERRNMWEDIAEERVEVPPQLRERVRRMLQQFRDTRKLPGGPKSVTAIPPRRVSRFRGKGSMC